MGGWSGEAMHCPIQPSQNHERKISLWHCLEVCSAFYRGTFPDFWNSGAIVDLKRQSWLPAGSPDGHNAKATQRLEEIQVQADIAENNALYSHASQPGGVKEVGGKRYGHRCVGHHLCFFILFATVKTAALFKLTQIRVSALLIWTDCRFRMAKHRRYSRLSCPSGLVTVPCEIPLKSLKIASYSLDKRFEWSVTVIVKYNWKQGDSTMSKLFYKAMIRRYPKTINAPTRELEALLGIRVWIYGEKMATHTGTQILVCAGGLHAASKQRGIDARLIWRWSAKECPRARAMARHFRMRQQRNSKL